MQFMQKRISCLSLSNSATNQNSTSNYILLQYSLYLTTAGHNCTPLWNATIQAYTVFSSLHPLYYLFVELWRQIKFGYQGKISNSVAEEELQSRRTYSQYKLEDA